MRLESSVCFYHLFYLTEFSAHCAVWFRFVASYRSQYFNQARLICQLELLFIFFGLYFLGPISICGMLTSQLWPIVTKVQRRYSALQMYFWEALKLLFANWRFSCKQYWSQRAKHLYTGNDSSNSSSRQNGEHEPVKTGLYIHWHFLFSRTLFSVIELVLKQDVD